MTFFNIFSNKKEENIKKKLLLIADNREKNSLVISELIRRGCEITFEQLAIGDYLTGEIVAERKTAQDFQNSIIDGRMKRQIENIKRTQKPVIIVEGRLEKNQERIHENALRGMIISIQIFHKVPLIHTINEKETADYLCLLAKERKMGESTLRIVPPKLTENERLQYILEGFPESGPITAKKLLKELKSIKNIIDADEETLERIVGKRGKEIARLVRKEYHQEP